jgi:hypothetical protein
MEQQLLLVFGVHPTCSLSTMSSDPGSCEPSLLTVPTRMQYVVPDYKSTACAVEAPTGNSCCPAI